MTIHNRRQYRITCLQRDRLAETLEALEADMLVAALLGDCDRASDLARASLRGQIADLDLQLVDYEYRTQTR